MAAVTGLTKHNPLSFWDEAAARTSIERILDAADVICPGHDQPFPLVGNQIGYRRPMRMVLQGLDPDDPGLTWDRSPREQWVSAIR